MENSELLSEQSNKILVPATKKNRNSTIASILVFTKTNNHSN